MKVLLALADGRSLPATMLAVEAGVAPSTVSHHLARLVDAGLICFVPKGRFRFFKLAGPQVGDLIETVARVAPPQPVTSLRQGTRAHAMRYARRCYDHLAGRLGVAVLDTFRANGLVIGQGTDHDGTSASYALTPAGAERLSGIGLALPPGETARACLDWTEQRPHLAGKLGHDLLAFLLSKGWVASDKATRAVRVTDLGRKQLPDSLQITLPDSLR